MVCNLDGGAVTWGSRFKTELHWFKTNVSAHNLLTRECQGKCTTLNVIPKSLSSPDGIASGLDQTVLVKQQTLLAAMDGSLWPIFAGCDDTVTRIQVPHGSMFKPYQILHLNAIFVFSNTSGKNLPVVQLSVLPKTGEPNISQNHSTLAALPGKPLLVLGYPKFKNPNFS